MKTVQGLFDSLQQALQEGVYSGSELLVESEDDLDMPSEFVTMTALLAAAPDADLCDNCGQRVASYEQAAPSGTVYRLCGDCDQHSFTVLQELDT